MNTPGYIVCTSNQENARWVAAAHRWLRDCSGLLLIPILIHATVINTEQYCANRMPPRLVPGKSRDCNRQSSHEAISMKLKVIVHEAEEGGYWAEVPAIPGCVSQGESVEELLRNIHEAVEGCLSVDVEHIDMTSSDTVMEITV